MMLFLPIVAILHEQQKIGAEEAIGIIVLDELTQILPGGDVYTFNIATPRRVYEMCAVNSHQRNTWVSSLQEICQRLREQNQAARS